MSSTSTYKRSGMGLLSWVFLLFLGLKLGGVDPVSGWSYWWVFAPLWAPWLVVGVIFLLGLLGIAIVHIADGRSSRKRRRR